MMERVVLTGCVLSVFLLVIGLSAGVAAAQGVADRYIVVLRPGFAPAEVARDHGLSPTHSFTRALNGFAATVPPSALGRLRGDPRVLFVEQDQEVHAFVGSQGKNGGQTSPAQPAQVVPTGVQRVGVDTTNSGSGIRVGIIDTGVQLNHPDLKVINGKTCVTGTKSANDDNGHGTHVAGIAGASDNTIGSRGVAPGVDVVAVKVLAKNGSGFISWVICGVDWVTGNAAALNMWVANMSLGAQGTSDALRLAISNSVAAGITYVVAAGNGDGTCQGGQDVLASSSIPALYSFVITVTALADSNGAAGGGGSATATCSYPDDSWAGFSNYGNKENDGINGGKVELGAPGVDIYSTYKGSSYATLSGTSMATPHVAGAAALYIKTQRAAGLIPTPADVKATLMSVGEANPAVVPDGKHQERLVHAGNL